MGKKQERREKGITLVALVITIIVLLILAGVTLATLTGENGILTRAQEAKNETEKAQKEEENILNDYEDKINEYAGIDWDTVLANAQKHPDQRISTAIGVGTDGRAVNMDLWEYTLLDDGNYGLNDEESLAATGVRSSGYKGKIIDGRIEGTIPQYIKGSEDTEFKKVTNLAFTFDGIETLEELPIIPNTVTSIYNTFRYCNIINIEYLPDSIENMQGAFYGCEKLKTVSKLPKNVKNLSWTFRGCTSLVDVCDIPNNTTNLEATFSECSNLIIAPNIPESAINMYATFSTCTSLTTVKRIPSNVNNLINTFSGCTNLQGELKIDANVTGQMIDGQMDYRGCFWQACTAEGIQLKISGNCAILDEIVGTAGSDSNILVSK